MRDLSAADILAIWERGASQPPLHRSLTLLAAAGERRAALAELPIGERDRRLWELRENLFGPGVEALTQCPACAERIEFQFNTSDVRRPQNPNLKPEHELKWDDWFIRFRLPDTNDLAALAAKEPGHAEAELAARCLVRAERSGQEVSITNLPRDAWQAVQHKMSELDPQAEVRFALSCPACAHGWSALFDIAQFFWTEIAAAARRLLREVDTLARAYGWSETEILNLSATRRQAYLELAGS